MHYQDVVECNLYCRAKTRTGLHVSWLCEPPQLAVHCEGKKA